MLRCGDKYLDFSSVSGNLSATISASPPVLTLNYFNSQLSRVCIVHQPFTMWYVGVMSSRVVLTRSSVPSLPILHAGTSSTCVSDLATSPVDLDVDLRSNAGRKKEMVTMGFLPGELPPEDGKDDYYFYCSECGDGPTGRWQGFCSACGSKAPPKKKK